MLCSGRAYVSAPNRQQTRSCPETGFWAQDLYRKVGLWEVISAVGIESGLIIGYQEAI
jgi:hypothetical protein